MSDREIELGAVRVFDGGVISDSKPQAVKVLEEAAEAVEAWKDYDVCRRAVKMGMEAPGAQQLRWSRMALSNELADVVQAACNLAFECGIDMRAALDRCERRNRERGRIVGA